MRILAHPPRRLRDTNQCQHLNGACLCGLLVEVLDDPQRLTDLTADGQYRFRLVIGSWKIIEISLPRMVRISRSESCSRSFAWKRTEPRSCPGARG